MRIICKLTIVLILSISTFFYSNKAIAQDDHGNTALDSTPITTDGTLVSGSFEIAGDYDWFSFSSVAGVTYVIETSELSDGCDTVIYLWNENASNYFATNDDFDSGSLRSKIEWEAISSGTIYIAVTHYNYLNDTTGIYNISASSDDPLSDTPTHDATGTWTYSTSNNWVNAGSAGCTPESNETVSVTINQSRTSVDVIIKGVTYTGTVNGATYSGTASYAEEGGTTTTSVSFTLSSNASGFGEVVWSWTDGSESCNGGSDISIAKSNSSQPIQDSGGGGGGGCFINNVTNWFKIAK